MPSPGITAILNGFTLLGLLLVGLVGVWTQNDRPIGTVDNAHRLAVRCATR